MPDLNIDRLSLHLSGITEEEGRRLARLIADGLANASMTESAGDRDAFPSRISITSGGNLQELSDRIVTELVRQLDRSV